MASTHNAVTTASEVPVAPKRGRGRPRKNPVMTGQTLVTASLTPTPAPTAEVKRGRGRPRKTPLAVTVTPPIPVAVVVAAGAGVLKRGRGRPRKNPLPVQSSPVSAASAPINIPVTPAKKTSSYISHARALELMENNKGHFFTAVFIKKDQTERVMNCKLMANQVPDRLGYIKVKEASLLRQGKEAIRNVNLQTLKTLSIGQKEYRIR